jgi:hypothetical protein
MAQKLKAGWKVVNGEYDSRRTTLVVEEATGLVKDANNPYTDCYEAEPQYTVCMDPAKPGEDRTVRVSIPADPPRLKGGLPAGKRYVGKEPQVPKVGQEFVDIRGEKLFTVTPGADLYPIHRCWLVADAVWPRVFRRKNQPGFVLRFDSTNDCGASYDQCGLVVKYTSNTFAQWWRDNQDDPDLEELTPEQAAALLPKAPAYKPGEWVQRCDGSVVVIHGMLCVNTGNLMYLLDPGGWFPESAILGLIPPRPESVEAGWELTGEVGEPDVMWEGYVDCCTGVSVRAGSVTAYNFSGSFGRRRWRVRRVQTETEKAIERLAVNGPGDMFTKQDCADLRLVLAAARKAVRK